MRNVSDKSCSRKSKHNLCSTTFYKKSCPLWDNVEKHCIAGQATDDNMAHAHCMLYTEGNKHAVGICNTYCSSTAAMVARTRLNVTLHGTLLAWVVSCHRSLSALKTEAVSYSVTLVTLWEPQISQPKVVFVTSSFYRADCCLFRCAYGVSYLASLGLLCPKPGVWTVSQERLCCRPGDRLGGVRFPRGTEIFLPFRVILPAIWPTKLHIRRLKGDSSRD